MVQSQFLENLKHRILTVVLKLLLLDDRRDWNDMMSGKREEQLDNLNKELKIQMTKTHEMKDKHDERKQLIDSTMEKISDIFK